MITNLNISKNINFFQKVKNLIGEISLNNMHSDLAVKCLSLVSYFNKIRTSK